MKPDFLLVKLMASIEIKLDEASYLACFDGGATNAILNQPYRDIG